VKLPNCRACSSHSGEYGKLYVPGIRPCNRQHFKGVYSVRSLKKELFSPEDVHGEATKLNFFLLSVERYVGN
jgi:hypothetical protein